ncbi:MAG: extracellular solute-binding protein, partial [Christensenellales bacterium]
MKKLLTLMLALCIALTMCSGALASRGTYTSGGVEFELTDEGYPVMAEPITVSVVTFATTPEGAGAWETPNDIVFFKNMKEKTNIDFTWEVLSSSAWSERVQLLIAGDTLPDVFLKSRFSATQLAKYGTDGSLYNMLPNFETYAPDFYAYMTEHDLLKYIVTNEGVYGMPYIYDSEGIRLNKLYINTEWLKNVGKEMPTSFDELHDVMVAFRDNDANGNGDATDEIPAGFQDMSDMLATFSNAYGLMNRGAAMGQSYYLDADPADESGNTLRFWYADDAMKDVLRMAKQYYDEGLIPSTFFDADYNGSQWSQFIGENRYGMHDAWTSAAGDQVDNFIAMDRAPSDTWNYCYGYVGTKGGLVITKECQYPEAMMAWGNYMYTMQGAYDYFLGVEGETYTIDEDGHTQLTDWVLHNPDGLSSEQALLRYSIYSGGANPGLCTDDTFKGGETYWTSLEGNKKFDPYLVSPIWEVFPLSEEGSEIVNNTRADISAVINEYCAGFVAGRKDIDADWDEYKTRLEQAGLEDYV